MSREPWLPEGMGPVSRSGSIVSSSVDLALDGEGFFGRECPEADCLAYFKVHVDEFPEARTQGAMTCPVCCHTASDQAFYTQEQLAVINAAQTEMAYAVAISEFDRMMRRTFPHSGGGRRSGITYTPAQPRAPRPLPRYREQATVRTFHCPNGHRAVVYDLIAACPYCGPDTPPRAIFDDALTAMAKLVAVVGDAPADERARLVASGGQASLQERTLVGIVAALQTLAKQLHARDGCPAPKGNPWQNVDRLGHAWLKDMGWDPIATLPPAVVAILRLAFARRHLLEHNGGVVDDRYVRESGDVITIGRRVRITSGSVEDLRAAAVMLANALEPTVESPTTSDQT